MATVEYNVKVKITGATGSQTSTAVKNAIRSGVAGLSGFGSPAVVNVQVDAGNSAQDITVRKIPGTKSKN